MKMISLFILLLLVSFNYSPKIEPDFPDPMILKAKDGYYYAYATGMQVSRSKDLIHWERPRNVMPEKPKWARRWNNFWAPHVIEKEGTYYLFYSAQPDWSENENMRLGVAKSRHPYGPFKDIGAHLDTGEAEENLDSMPFKDPVSGKIYLYWGRNGVITVQEMNEGLDGFAKGSSPVEILWSSKRKYEGIVEAPYVIYRHGLYYLFYSGDDCCTDPHYAVLGASSKSPTGPFKKFLRPSLVGNDQWQNPGHNAVFKDKKGKDWVVYHAIDSRHPRKENGYIYRVMRISPLEFRRAKPVADAADSLDVVFKK